MYELAVVGTNSVIHYNAAEHGHLVGREVPAIFGG